MTEDGYLVKEFQGGTNPIILGIEYDSDRDTRNAAPFGDTSALHTLVAQVCEREGITVTLSMKSRIPSISSGSRTS